MPSPNPPPLHDLQRVFAAALIEGDAPALAPWIAARGIDSEARVRIYRNAGYAIHVDALETVFPALHALVGEACFDGLATRYTARRGSDSGNLQHFGADFPAFVPAQPETAALAWLGDVARLEWLRQEALLAAAGPAHDAPELLAALDETAGPLYLRLSPHVRVLIADAPALDLWRYAHDPEHRPQPDPDGPGQCVLLWREDGAIGMCEISAPQAACISALRAGEALQTALQAHDQVALAERLQPLIQHDLIQAATTTPPES